ncbi:MAG: hypothetical protein WB800_32310, partial [Streptosporangiaceae bacterium]
MLHPAESLDGVTAGRGYELSPIETYVPAALWPGRDGSSCVRSKHTMLAPGPDTFTVQVAM